MASVRCVWIDLRECPSGDGLFRLLPANCRARRIDRFDGVLDAIRRNHPAYAGIEFDYPNRAGLRVVPMLRREYPNLPLLIFTEFHSEALAVWTFRWRVWDYRVHPVDAATLACSVAAVESMLERRCHDPNCDRCLPESLIEPAGSLQMPPAATLRTRMAVAYIAGHYADHIRRDALADLCHLSPSQFSRSFRLEQKTTFEHFLLEYRIARACELLAASSMPIAEVACDVGFNDAAYFSRAFRRLVGVTASHYRRQQ